MPGEEFVISHCFKPTINVEYKRYKYNLAKRQFSSVRCSLKDKQNSKKISNMTTDSRKFGLQTVLMPSVGLGCWQSAPGEIEKAIEWSLDAGVRLIDTAFMYENEKEIGDVLTRYIKSGMYILCAI